MPCEALFLKNDRNEIAEDYYYYLNIYQQNELNPKPKLIPVSKNKQKIRKGLKMNLKPKNEELAESLNKIQENNKSKHNEKQQLNKSKQDLKHNGSIQSKSTYKNININCDVNNPDDINITQKTSLNSDKTKNITKITITISSDI